MSATTASGSMQRQYSRSSSTGSSSENLPPRTLARIAREVRDLHKNTPEGIKLTFDGDCGGSLGELLVSLKFDSSPWSNIVMRIDFFHVYQSFDSVGRLLQYAPQSMILFTSEQYFPNCQLILLFFDLILISYFLHVFARPRLKVPPVLHTRASVFSSS